MEELFQNTDLHSELDEKGVLTHPLLNAAEVEDLRSFYNELHPDGIPPQMRDGIHMTIWCSDRAYKEKIREKLMSVLQPACERVFKDFRVVSPVFIVKRKGSDTTFPIHQDWNVVDEEKHRAFNVWIPLHPVDADNGSLWHVPGSHRLPTVVRGAGLLFPNLYGIQNHIGPAMHSLSLEAGQAMIFYHRLIHGSPPNTAEQPRIVISFSLLPKEVPLHIYFQKDEKSPLQVYHPDDQFIYRFDNVRDDTPFVPPGGQLVEERPPYVPVKLTPELFNEYFPGLIPEKEEGIEEKAGQDEKISFWNRVKKLFSA